MCMLCVVPPHTMPSRDKLENSALNNPHGYGFGIVIPSENRILVQHSMNADESIENFLALRERYQEGYAMWHARFATHGSMTLDNCHPFAMGGTDTNTYVAHNGILSVIEKVSDLRSDTRIFVEDLLPAIGGITAFDNEQVWNLLEDFATGSKVCVLTVDPRAKYQMYLLNESTGRYDTDKVWWSNDSCQLNYGLYDFRTPVVGLPVGVTTYGGLRNQEDYRWNDYTWCDVCEWYGEDEDSIVSICPQCSCCLLCLSISTDCLCYKPKSYKDYYKDYTYGGYGL